MSSPESSVHVGQAVHSCWTLVCKHVSACLLPVCLLLVSCKCVRACSMNNNSFQLRGCASLIELSCEAS
jgi:hypothetical protein